MAQRITIDTRDLPILRKTEIIAPDGSSFQLVDILRLYTDLVDSVGSENDLQQAGLKEADALEARRALNAFLPILNGSHR